ncbi:MAG: hypothetical protein IID03_09750 [Candidatus Dadabacteria bacterium]|nr:hypothetical protein [Candidatus Dadabacteria bacterium]
MGVLAEQHREEDYTKDSIESKESKIWGFISKPDRDIWLIPSQYPYKMRRIGLRIKEKQNIVVKLDDEIILEIPPKFDELFKSIEKSKYILDLEDDWDDEGSPAYDKTTWIRAIKFIYNYTKKIYDERGKVIEPPKISQGPEGSIDILWKKESYRLLINIPLDYHKPGSFYGDDYHDVQFKGPIKTNNDSRWLALSYLHIL